MDKADEIEAISWLQTMIQFNTVSGDGPTNGGYNSCAKWLVEKCTNIGLESEILADSLENKPIVVAKWNGSDPSLPVVILNSHYDVVPGELHID